METQIERTFSAPRDYGSFSSNASRQMAPAWSLYSKVTRSSTLATSAFMGSLQFLAEGPKCDEGKEGEELGS